MRSHAWRSRPSRSVKRSTRRRTSAVAIPAAAASVAKRKRDYYLVLGVERDASEGDIKRAFRELARKHHPDVNPADAGEAFREINEAYAVLSDRDARARYDRRGHVDTSGAGGSLAGVV